MLAPGRRQRCDRRRALEHIARGCSAHLQREDVRHGHAAGLAMSRMNVVATAEFTFLNDSQIESRSAARDEALQHVVASEPDAELETRLTRLRHLEFRTADP